MHSSRASAARGGVPDADALIYHPVRAAGVVHAVPYYPRPDHLKPGQRVEVIAQCATIRGTLEPDGTPVTCIACFLPWP